MGHHQNRRARAARAQAATRPAGQGLLIIATALSIIGFGLSVAHGQPVPEVVKPQSDAPTVPPSSSGPTVQPKSENPLADSGTARPIPDTGVIAPPSSAGSTPVIRPPSTGTMPIIPPPGSSGGDRSVIPK